jgi:hypothetical protein
MAINLKDNGGYARPNAADQVHVTQDQAKSTDLSFMARLVNGVKYILGKTGTLTDPISVPFGPGQPLPPVFQDGMRGRQFDYQVSTNLNYVPRQEEAISFHQLRGLADGYDLMRLAIETAKDDAVRVDYLVVPRDEDKKPDARCEKVMDFLSYPDREHDFKTWLRMLMEDYLVCDALTVYPRKTKGGDLYSLEPMDGALIKRVLDTTGRTPRPPDVAYQQYIKGVPAVDYSLDELIYFPRNQRTWKVYGMGPVEQVIMTVNIAIRRQLHQLSFYTDGNMPELLISVPEAWNPDQIAQFQTWWDSIMVGNLKERRQGKFIPHGNVPYDVKESALKDEYDEWLARVICYCFGLTNTPFIKQMNRATSQQQSEQSKEEGAWPRIDYACSLMNVIIAKHFGYPDLKCIPKVTKDVDPLVQAQIDNIYLGGMGAPAVVSPDEVRQRLGIEGTAPEPPEPVAPAIPDPNDPDNPSNSDGIKPSQKGSKGKVKQATNKDDVTKVERKKKLSPINRNRASIIKARKALIKVFKPFLTKTAANDMATQIQKGLDKLNRAAVEDGLAAQRILAELDFQGWAVVIDPTSKTLRKIYKDGSNVALAQIGFDAGEDIADVLNQKSLQYAMERAAELVGMRNVGTEEDSEWITNPNAEYSITESTRENLKGLVTQAIEEGWSPQVLKAAIKESELFSSDRAETIARTEVAFADSAGNMAAYRESGVVKGKSWIVGSEHDNDDECDENADAGIIGIDESFPSGDDTSPAHPSCVCDVLPELEVPDEDQDEED